MIFLRVKQFQVVRFFFVGYRSQYSCRVPRGFRNINIVLIFFQILSDSDRKQNTRLKSMLKAMPHYNVLANVCRRMKNISSTPAYAEIDLKIRENIILNMYKASAKNVSLAFLTYEKPMHNDRITSEALPGVLGTGQKGIYFRGTGEQRSNFEGNKDNIGEQGT